MHAVFVACNKEEVIAPTGDFLADVAKISTRPDYESIFSDGDVTLIQKAVDGSATADEMKDAVLALYNTANRSRISENKGLSLMVQDSLGGNKMGKVYMHGFTLQRVINGIINLFRKRRKETSPVLRDLRNF